MNNPRPDEKLYKQTRSEVAIGAMLCLGVFIMLLCSGN